MRGRKPKPTALKIAEGNPGRRPLNKNEPVPPEGELIAPPWLEGEALRIFNEDVVPLVLQMGVGTVADIQALARYAHHLNEWRKAAQWLEKHGSKFPVRAKEPPHTVIGFQQYPEVAIYRQISKLLLAMEAEFGMTPSARTRVQATHGFAMTEEDRKAAEFFGDTLPIRN
jgi:P27 family predicted phage terminase small subunit